MSKAKNWNEKLDIVFKHTTDEIHKIYSPQAQKAIVSFIYNRLAVLDKYDPSSAPPLRTPITLLVPEVPAVQLPDGEYGLEKVTYIYINSYW